jgi:hypothetical protein
MDVDEEKRFNYTGCDVVDGKLRILFHPKYLGTNISDALVYLPDALNKAEQPAGKDGKPPVMGVLARLGISKDYAPQIGAVEEKINKMLKTTIKLNPMWDENFAALKAGKDVRDDWEKEFGNMVFLYFQGAATQMEYQKFGEDDMLQEGLLEAIEKHEIAFRVVDKLVQNHSSYNECLIEDGVLYIRVR